MAVIYSSLFTAKLNVHTLILPIIIQKTLFLKVIFTTLKFLFVQ